MLEDKHVQVTETYDPDGIPTTGQKAGTAEDREAMGRLGKQQVFKVSHRAPYLAYVMI